MEGELAPGDTVEEVPSKPEVQSFAERTDDAQDEGDYQRSEDEASVSRGRGAARASRSRSRSRSHPRRTTEASQPCHSSVIGGQGDTSASATVKSSKETDLAPVASKCDESGGAASGPPPLDAGDTAEKHGKDTDIPACNSLSQDGAEQADIGPVRGGGSCTQEGDGAIDNKQGQRIWVYIRPTPPRPTYVYLKKLCRDYLGTHEALVHGEVDSIRRRAFLQFESETAAASLQKACNGKVPENGVEPFKVDCLTDEEKHGFSEAISQAQSQAARHNGGYRGGHGRGHERDHDEQCASGRSRDHGNARVEHRTRHWVHVRNIPEECTSFRWFKRFSMSSSVRKTNFHTSRGGKWALCECATEGEAERFADQLDGYAHQAHARPLHADTVYSEEREDPSVRRREEYDLQRRTDMDRRDLERRGSDRKDFDRRDDHRDDHRDDRHDDQRDADSRRDADRRDAERRCSERLGERGYERGCPGDRGGGRVDERRRDEYSGNPRDSWNGIDRDRRGDRDRDRNHRCDGCDRECERDRERDRREMRAERCRPDGRGHECRADRRDCRRDYGAGRDRDVELPRGSNRYAERRDRERDRMRNEQDRCAHTRDRVREDERGRNHHRGDPRGSSGRVEYRRFRSRTGGGGGLERRNGHGHSGSSGLSRLERDQGDRHGGRPGDQGRGYDRWEDGRGCRDHSHGRGDSPGQASFSPASSSRSGSSVLPDRKETRSQSRERRKVEELRQALATAESDTARRIAEAGQAKTRSEELRAVAAQLERDAAMKATSSAEAKRLAVEKEEEAKRLSATAERAESEAAEARQRAAEHGREAEEAAKLAVIAQKAAEEASSQVDKLRADLAATRD